MFKKKRAEALKSDLPLPRAAELQEPKIVRASFLWWLISGLIETALIVAFLIAIFLFVVAISTHQPGYLPYDYSFWLLAFGALITDAAASWLWRQVCRRRSDKDRVELLADAKQAFSSVRFRDGSTSDFVPEGTIVMANRMALSFDTRRRLVRISRGRNRNDSAVTVDQLWGLEDVDRFDVRDARVGGTAGKLLRMIGFGRRIQPALVFVMRNGDETKRMRVAPGFEKEVHTLIPAMNAALAVANRTPTSSEPKA